MQLGYGFEGQPLRNQKGLQEAWWGIGQMQRTFQPGLEMEKQLPDPQHRNPEKCRRVINELAKSDAESPCKSNFLVCSGIVLDLLAAPFLHSLRNAWDCTCGDGFSKDK